MPRPIDKNLLADMFARAAELRAAHAGENKAAAGRVLLSSIFARARQLQGPRQARGPEEETTPLGRPRGGDQTARGWNEEADQRARPAQAGVDPDDLVRTRHLDRESAVEEFRSSLETLFADSDSGEEMLIATEPSAKPAPAPAPGPPSADQPARGPKLFTAAAEELFGMAMEDLEELVLAAWERRMRGEPAPPPAGPPAVAGLAPAAYAAGPVASPALVSLEDGELLLDKPKKKDLSSSDVDHILTDFSFDGGNPVPAAEVVRRSREQPVPQSAPQPVPQSSRHQAPAARDAAAATFFDPFARPIPLPAPRPPAADAFAAPAARGAPLDAFAPPPGVDAFGRPRPTGHTPPPPSWRTGSGPQPALPPTQGPTWRASSGQQPALPGGWQPQAPQAPQAPQPQQPLQAAPHVPAGWPFVDGPTVVSPQRAPSARLEPPVPPASGRHTRPPAPGKAPPPAGAKPRSPPSGEGFDPFAPSWWDDKPSDGDVKL